jgi:hypothetical protein
MIPDTVEGARNQRRNRSGPRVMAPLEVDFVLDRHKLTRLSAHNKQENA